MNKTCVRETDPLSYLHSQIVCCDDTTVPYKDYQLIVQELYRLRLKNRVTEKDTKVSTKNKIALKYVNLQDEFNNLKEENEYLKNTLKNLTSNIERETLKYEQLMISHETMGKMYTNIKKEKEIIENEQTKLVQEKEYVESVLLKKTKEFADLMDNLNSEVNQLKEEKTVFEVEKLKWNQMKSEQIKKEKRKNSKTDKKTAKRRVTEPMDFGKSVSFSFNEDFIDIDQKLSERKVVLDRADCFKVHDTVDRKNKYAITAMTMNEQHRYIATAGLDEKIIVSDNLSYFKEICTFYTKGVVTNSLCFVENSGLLCAGTSNKDIDIYSLKKSKRILKFNGHADCVNVVDQLGDLKVVSGSQDRTAKLWDLKKTGLISSFIFPSSVLSLQTSRSSIVTGHFDGRLRVSSVNTKKTIFDLEMFAGGEIRFMKIFPNDTILLAGRDRQFKIFDLRRMEPSKSFSLEEENIVDQKRVSFGVDINFTKFLAGTFNGDLKVFNISGKFPELITKVKLNDENEALPFTLYSEFMDKAYVADYSGYVNVVDLRFD